VRARAEGERGVKQEKNTLGWIKKSSVVEKIRKGHRKVKQMFCCFARTASFYTSFFISTRTQHHTHAQVKTTLTKKTKKKGEMTKRKKEKEKKGKEHEP